MLVCLCISFQNTNLASTTSLHPQPPHHVLQRYLPCQPGPPPQDNHVRAQAPAPERAQRSAQGGPRSAPSPSERSQRQLDQALQLHKRPDASFCLGTAWEE
ncbi:guanine nucleotide-binding protein subunit gamma [Cryptococcus amylolentus CBS 6039]|uniref:Guanine nucleotide-binding protein subunit gamma n=1 Tax=Cryptococcus amylolentus CBS 6039 TaxID=1295533 RepID=A0A1E3HY16_9TREE|nr:guanine nucleotide-binding protein subunit gamma [Cryptococcus amylolentus CBS 6039]ODN81045.1 guanine nucleotide-binding protein subunit gamma [Cryptococcus amylolentus CBS 6039]